jgi:triacylglycerol esterase/lipase EstA (alpha/beta hydrolase family)
MPLTPDKQAELQRALAEAGDEVIARPTELTPSFVAPLADGDLHIVQHKDSGCIQFVFPAPGQQLLPEARRGAEWILRAALRARERMTQAAIEKIERFSKPEGLVALRRGFDSPVFPTELAAARGRRVLLLVHGVFSSVEGGFGDLAGDAGMRQLLERYDGHVFGYNHWTIARTPQQNALDLLARIPADGEWQLDLLCHSRGGLVVRSLLAESEADAVLAQIASQRPGRIASIGKVVFVAAANHGSPLAEPEELQHFLNVAAMLASFSGGMALDVVIGLARVVVSLGFERPSVKAMASGSALVAALNRGGTLLDSASTWYARANFNYGESVLQQTGALINRVLMAAVDNDVVVPYDSVVLAAPADGHILNFGTPQRKQSEVWHTEFFRQPEMQSFLLRHLR